MKQLSLRLKLYISVIMLLLILGIGLIITAQTSVRELGRYIDRETQENIKKIVTAELEATAGNYGEKVASQINQAFQIPQVMKSLIEFNISQDESERMSRTELQHTLESVLTNNSISSSIYAHFEPNSYDSNDAFFAGVAEHSSKTGALEIYFYRDPNGDVKFSHTEDSSFKYDTTLDEFGIRAAEWYLCSRDKNKPCLMDPYQYEISKGYTELMTSLVVPMYNNGKFAGVTGTDINLSVLKGMMQDVSKALYNGQSRVTLLSDSGRIVASSHYNDKVLRPLSEALPKNADRLVNLHNNEQFLEEDGHLFVSHKVNISAAGNEWSLLIELPSEVALADAIAMSENIGEAISSSAYEQTLFGTIILIVAIGIIMVLVRSVIKPLDEIDRRMRNLSSSEGDLTQELHINTHAELIHISEGFNVFIQRLRSMVNGLKEVGRQVNHQSLGVTRISKETEDQALQQREHIESVVVAMNQMSFSAAEVSNVATELANNATSANEDVYQTQNTLNEAAEGVDALAGDMSKASDAITHVAQRSEDINSILEVIRGIAEQTNLLALNAAIEAARAGDHGRGFAVVADEVRTLASKTRESTDEITAMIDALKEGVEKAVDIIHAGTGRAHSAVDGSKHASESLSAVVERIGSIVSGIEQVATAAKEQSTVSEDINKNLTQIGDTATELQELSNQVYDNGAALSDQVAILDKELSQLKT